MPPVLRRDVVFAVVLYCACSSSLLFFNKIAVSELAPGDMVVIQIAFSTTLCGALAQAKVISIDGAFEPRRVKLFSLYVFAFVGSIYSSAMALRHSNVETVIVFRASTPLAVSALEVVFLGRQVPDAKSLTALLATAISAAFYVATDAQFIVEGLAGYSWCFAYFGLVCFEMTFGKHLVSKSVRTGVWESVFLTNFMALPILIVVAVLTGDMRHLAENVSRMDAAGLSVLVTSAAVSFTIGYAGWLCRSLVSATTYTLIGVLNKLGTVLLSVFFLDKHASNGGILALLLCIAASSQYSQAPLSSASLESSKQTDRDDVEQKGQPLSNEGSNGVAKSSAHSDGASSTLTNHIGGAEPAGGIVINPLLREGSNGEMGGDGNTDDDDDVKLSLLTRSPHQTHQSFSERISQFFSLS